MDNFIDKLAQRFSAQEMIKANSQAEAEEMRRLQLQISEYEKVLQEMRKLNYRNAELSEKIDRTTGSAADAIRDIREEGQKLVAALRGLMEEQDRKRKEELKEREEARSLVAAMRRLISEQVEKNRGDLEKREKEEAGLLSSLRAIVEEQERRRKEMLEEEETAQNLISSMKELMQEQTRSREAERGKKDEQEILTISLRELTDEHMRNRETEKNYLGVLKELADEQARSRGAEQNLVAALRELLEEQTKSREEELERARRDESGRQKDTSAIMETLEDKFQHSEDFVHKESVKVYRNVQAIIVDELKRCADNSRTEQNRINALLGKVMIFCIMSMIVSASGAALWVLTFLGIIGK